MSIARDPTSGALSKDGTSTTDFWLITDAAPTRATMREGFVTPSDNVKIAVRPSADGKTRFECGIESTQLVIRKFVLGAFIEVSAATAHAVPANTPGRVRVTQDGDVITAYVGTSDADEVSVSITRTEYKQFSNRMGVILNVPNAVVPWFEYDTLRDRVLTLSQVGVAVIGGGVYRSVTDGQWFLVAAGVFNPDVRCDMAALASKMRIIGGNRAVDYFPLTNTVADAIIADGTLPGQAVGIGTTATLIDEFQGGLAYAGSPENNVSVKGSKINNPDSMLTGTRLFGGAYELGVGQNVTVGDAIVALVKGPDNSLFIGSTRSVNFVVGSPYAGTYEVITRSDTVGPAGPDAAARVAGPNGSDLMVIAAPEGLHLCPVGGAPVDLSGQVLARYLTFEREDRLLPILLRDASRRWLHIFIDRGSAADSVHLIYDERIAGYAGGTPGLYPIVLPFRVSAVGIVRGVPLIGTDDGRLVRFSTDVKTDLGAPIASKISAMLDAPPISNDLIVHRPTLELGDDSDIATVRFYGAETAERVFGADTRTLLTQCTMSIAAPPAAIRARAPFILAEITTDSGRLVVEKFEAMAATARRMFYGPRVEPAALPSPCTPPVTQTTPTPPPDTPIPPGPPGPTPPELFDDPAWYFDLNAAIAGAGGVQEYAGSGVDTALVSPTSSTDVSLNSSLINSSIY